MESPRVEEIDQSDWAFTRERERLGLSYADAQTATVTQADDAGLIVVGADDRRRLVQPHGFGDWKFLEGDVVAIGTDVHGNLHAIPKVIERTLTAQPIPALGSDVSMEDTSALVDSPEALASLGEALARAEAGTSLRVATIDNHRTGKARVWRATR
jgi:hypothetical protein